MSWFLCASRVSALLASSMPAYAPENACGIADRSRLVGSEMRIGSELHIGGDLRRVEAEFAHRVEDRGLALALLPIGDGPIRQEFREAPLRVAARAREGRKRMG